MSATSKVVVTLLPYRGAAADALTAAYGHDWISVVPSTSRYVPLTARQSATAGP